MALLTTRYVSYSAPSSPVTATTLTARLKNAEPGLHMTELIQQARVPIKKIQMNKAKNQPLQQKLAQHIAQDPALKHMAQKAFVSYMRSLHLQARPLCYSRERELLQERVRAFYYSNYEASIIHETALRRCLP